MHKSQLSRFALTVNISYALSLQYALYTASGIECAGFHLLIRVCPGVLAHKTLVFWEHFI